MGEIWLKAARDADSLTPLERIRHWSLLNALFRMLEQQFLLHSAGSLDAAVWKSIDSIIGDMIQADGTRAYLRERSHWYTDDFVAFLESKGVVVRTVVSRYLCKRG